MVKLTPNVGDVTRHRPGGGARRGRRPVADQHDQLDHGRRSRHARPEAGGRAARAATAATAARRSSRSPCTWSRHIAGDPEIERADQRHRRHPGLAGRGRVPAARAPARVQVCTAVMHYGFRIVEHLIERPGRLDAREGLRRRSSDFVGKSVPRIKTWGDLDLNYKVVAEIDQQKCIHCGLCYIACEDGAHQSIRWDAGADGGVRRGERRVNGHVRALRRRRGAAGRRRRARQRASRSSRTSCVGCNMCSLVCPVEGCITMKEVDTGKPPMTWNEYQELLAEGQGREDPAAGACVIS